MSTSQLHKTLLLKDIGNIALVNYEPAVLCEFNSGWLIEYRIMNPESGQLERKRLKFEKIRKRQRSDKEARRVAKTYCTAINEKLESGWNPYLEGKKAKSFHKITDALRSFVKEKELDFKNGVFLDDSMRTYRSQIDMLVTWINNLNPSMYVANFDKEIALQYLDYVYTTKQVSARTWNNYLKFLRTAWAWLIEKNYCSENIFQNIRPKVEKEKERVIIPEVWSKKIMEYFRENIPQMELVCGLLYNSFMRPAEICRTQIKNVKLESNAIYLPGNKTKNSRARWCLLPPHLVELVNKINLEKFPPNHYLLSSFLRPGKTKLDTRKLDKFWDKMRSAIDLRQEMKLYSYRDTGIISLPLVCNEGLVVICF